MKNDVSDTHPLLYHYTSAVGMEGILKSQKLWATNISFLNDVEEHIAYYQQRLPSLVGRASDNASQQQAGFEKLNDIQIEELAKTITRHNLAWNDPYVFSFSAPPVGREHNGLLSQWRGYGSDGGYAIVFESTGIDRLLISENKKYLYQSSFWGDTVYYNPKENSLEIPDEVANLENGVVNALCNYFLTGSETAFEPMFEPLTMLSCLYKHYGFHEEGEVRIVMLPYTEALLEAAKQDGDKRLQKPVNFRNSHGMLVPYIELFGNGVAENGTPLPIKKIIVGPHPEKHKRKVAVEKLLGQLGIDAEVLVSDIPYRGW